MSDLTLDQQRALAIAAARRARAQSQSLNVAAPTPPRSMYDRATQFFQRAGDLIPFADEVRAAGYAAQDIATGGGVEGAWQRARERDRAVSEAASANVQGLERVAADTLGLGTSILAPLGAARALGVALPAAPTAMGRIGQAAGTGAVAGGIVGAGEGEGLQQRGQNALGGTVLGGVLGGGIGGALEGVSGIARNIARMAPPRTTQGAQRRAVQRIARRLDFDDLSADAAGVRLAEMRRAGLDRPSLMETGPSMRGLARTLRDDPGVGTQQLDDFVESRLQNAPSAIRTRLDVGLMPEAMRTVPEAEVRPFYIERLREVTGPLYQSVSGAVSGANNTLRAVLQTPSGRQAVVQAQRAAMDMGEAFPQIYDDAGRLLRDLPDIDVRALHHIRYALDDMADMSAREGATRATVGPRRLRSMLDQVMKQASPSLARADEQYSFLMGGLDGLAIGQRFDRMSAQQLRQWMQSATAPQRMMARIAAANQLGGRIQNMADPTTVLRPGSQRLDAIRALFGSQEAADDFVRHIMAQREIAATRQAVSGGSLTSRNLAQREYEGEQLLMDAVADATTGGGIFSALRQSASRILRRMPGGMSAAERRALIDMLTETDPERLSAIFGDIAEEQARVQALNAAQGAANTVGAAGASASVVPTYTQP